MNRATLTRALFALLLIFACRPAWALGTETFGNEPLIEGNYADWPGIMPAVNHSSRVYHTWVNGNEHFYYRGDTAALNDFLKAYAGAKTEVREVVLRPGPGVTHSFDRSRTIDYGWKLHLIGGIARHLTTRPEGSKVWSPHPVVTIHPGGDIDLDKLEIPKGLTVTPLAEVKKRTREGLKSGDKTVRGWAAGVLAELDAYDSESRDAISALLKDEDNWVRLNAAGALPHFGRTAKSALPLLRAAMETNDAQLKERLQASIQAIEQAEDRSAAAREHRETLARINRFLARAAR